MWSPFIVVETGYVLIVLIGDIQSFIAFPAKMRTMRAWLAAQK